MRRVTQIALVLLITFLSGCDLFEGKEEEERVYYPVDVYNSLAENWEETYELKCGEEVVRSITQKVDITNEEWNREISMSGFASETLNFLSIADDIIFYSNQGSLKF